jgi:hypothetical protein
MRNEAMAQSEDRGSTWRKDFDLTFDLTFERA